MVAFSKNDLPNEVNTVEKLLVWAATLMHTVAPDVTRIEGPNVAERSFTSQPYFVNVGDASDWGWLEVQRQAIQLSPTWQAGGKLWTHAQEMSTSTIPTAFKSA